MTKKIAYKDFTIKAQVADFFGIESALQRLSPTFAGVDHQKDTYFKVPKGKLKLRQGTIENLITKYERMDVEGVEKTTVYQYDLNPTDEQISKLFREHEIIGIIEKERKIYFLGNIKIHLDKTLDDKIFIEIEAIDSDDSRSAEELRTQCLVMKEKLGILDSQLTKTGYLSADATDQN